MGWFDDQIREQKRRDDLDFADAVEEIASSISGGKKTHYHSRRRQIKGAIDAVFRFYHIETQELPDSIEELEDQLEYLCRPHGVMRRRVKLEKGWYKDAVGAMLARTRDGQIVALLPNRFFGYSIWGEAGAKPIRLNSKTEELLEKEALCFYRPFPAEKIGAPELLRYIFKSVPLTSYALLGAVMLLATLVGMLSPYLTQILFSHVIVSGSIRVLAAITVFSLCVSVSTQLFKVIQAIITEKITTQANISVQAAAMARILSLPADFFKHYSPGELNNRVYQINALCASLFTAVLSSGFTSVFSLIYIGQIYTFAPGLAGPCLIITAVSLAHSLLNTAARIKLDRKAMEIASKKDGMTYSLLTGIQKIKLTGSEKRAFTRWTRLYNQEMRATYGIPRAILLSDTIATAIALTGTIVMYFFAIKTNVSMANYYAFTSAYGMVAGAFSALAGIGVQTAKIRPTLEMARPILETLPETNANKQVVSRVSGNIEISNVTFRYSETMPVILDNVSLKIRAGQYVAIVGKSGCGKSTLMRLLLGFEQPLKGAIYYDRKDIASMDLKSLRRHIGTVMQNGKLFQGDIFSNITISAPWLTLDDAWRAAELAGIADDIRAMPMGMHTVISEGSGGISGGQRQRLMIARAIAPKPRILFMDEATSALDNITQKKVSQFLDELKCTRVVIAHRLSTIRQCDRIVVLDSGKIVEDGTYDQLMARNGYFARLVERQEL